MFQNITSKHYLIYSAFFFFFVTSFFALTWRDGHYGSPDETANAFFIRQYVRTGSFRVAEPLNVIAEDVIHPRAVAIVAHDLAPGSFLGMLLLYGWTAKIFGLWIVPLLTPIFATIASFFFYKLVRLLFNERIARWSFFLLLLHPAWIYYTARSMFPNVLFLSLFIIGLYYLLQPKTYNLLPGLAIGTALAIRTSEAGWVLGVLALLWYAHRREVSWQRAVIIIACIVIAFLPVFYYNTQLYGNPFYNGYSQIDSEAVPAAFAWHFQSRFFSTIFSLLLPFGIKPFVLLSNAYQYLIWFFWWFAVPAVLGIAMLWKKEKKYIAFYAFAIVWLLLYYGSWTFRDTTLTGPTLGTSYTRYWLPIFVFSIPFVVVIFSRIDRSRVRFLAISIITLLSFWSVFFHNGESLFAIRKNTREARSVRTTIFDRTASNSVILTERSDKLFFPERRVIFNDPLDEKKIDRVITLLQKRVPVYYFTELQKNDIDFMNDRRLAQYGVRWTGGEEIGGQRLYALKLLATSY